MLSKALNFICTHSYLVQASLKLISSITSKEHSIFFTMKFLQMTLNTIGSKAISNAHWTNGEDCTRKEIWISPWSSPMNLCRRNTRDSRVFIWYLVNTFLLKDKYLKFHLHKISKYLKSKESWALSLIIQRPWGSIGSEFLGRDKNVT